MGRRAQLHTQPAGFVRRILRATAIVGVCMGVFFVTTLTTAGADADENTHRMVGVDFMGSTLALDSGITMPNQDATVDDFNSSVLADGPVLSWQFQDDAVGNARVVSAWRIVEDGAATHHWVTLSVSPVDRYCVIERDGGRTPDEVARYNGNNLIPEDNDSLPYSCNVTWEAKRGVVLQVVPVVWSSVEGSVTAAGPISLDQGHQTSRNQRFFVSGSLHQSSDPAADINSGQSTSWRAEMRNGEGATADDGARTDFSYRIVKGGVPTQYYVTGFTQNVKYLTGYDYTYECHIYDGDPSKGILTDSSPYMCDYDATESGVGHSNLNAKFTVQAR